MTKPFNISDWAKLFAQFRGIPIYTLAGWNAAVSNGATTKHAVLLRHDVDADLQAAVEMARLESNHGIYSTYFMLDTADYWQNKHELLTSIESILYYGHEIGWHNNVTTRHIRTQRPIPELINEALNVLRLSGADVIGTASHGDPLCHDYNYVNYQVWNTCPHPTERSVHSLSDFGLDYEAYFIRRTHYISESGGIWRQCDDIADFKDKGGVLQVLIHPQWWKL